MGMYHRLRVLHRWIGLIGSLFLVLISATGFLLATKSTFGWVRPPESKGTPLQSLSDLVAVDLAANAAFALGIKELKTYKDIDRIDYRPKSNVFKIVSKEGYQEVQVDGSTGEVLQVGFRLDQMAENIHDLSYFSATLRTYWLPVVAVLLFLLGVTGIFLFFVPVVRRWRYRHSQRA